MRTLRKLSAALACGSMLSWSASPALATMPGQTAQLQPKLPFHGPGSPGFLPNCSSVFPLENWTYSSNTFSNTGATGWNPATVGGTAPSFPNGQNTEVAPDGTTTATDLNIPAVPAGSSNYSILYSTTASGIPFTSFDSWTFQMWVKDLDGPGTGNAALSILATNAIATAPSVNANNHTTNPATGAAFEALYGTQYQNGFGTTLVPNNGQWNLVTVWVPESFVKSNIHVNLLSIGVDRRDNNQSSSVPAGTKHLAIWHAGFVHGYSEGGKGWPIDTNPAFMNGTAGPSAAINTTIQCPSTIAFRDFTQLSPWISNTRLGASGITQLTQQNANTDANGGKYEQGGTGNPFWGASSAYQLTGTYAGQYCGFASTTDGTLAASHNDWFTTILYCGSDMFHTAEARVGQPQIQIPGSVLATGAQTGGTSPCSVNCITNVNISNVSYNPSGTVTVTLASSVQFVSGVNVTIASVVGTGGATINGSFTNVQFVDSTHFTYQTNPSSSFTYTSGGTANLTAPMNSYILHSWWLPPNPATGASCNVNSTNYTYCLLLSAKVGVNGVQNHSMFLAYSNTIDSGWCIYVAFGNNCTNGALSIPGGVPTTIQPTAVMSSVLYGGGSNNALTAPSLPAIVQAANNLGGTGFVNFVITPGNSATQPFNLLADTVGDGLTWTPISTITYLAISGIGEWDNNGNLDRIDPGAHLNKCKFFELPYTSFLPSFFQGLAGSAKSQAIGEFIATDMRGPWYHLLGPGVAWKGPSPTMTPAGAIIKFDNTIYNGKTFIGEINMWEQYGQLFVTGNTDDGNGFSSGVGAYMHDACQ